MLKAIKRLLDAAQGETHPQRAHPRHHLQVAVAVLLHEARRADYAEADEESAAARQALVEMFGMQPPDAAELLKHGREKAQEATSFYGPLSVIKRELDMPERIRLVEHLWRVVFADGQLNIYEDHYVRKIAHLLYVSNTENMLARNRARG